jgi:glycosyl transferase family 25
MLPPIFVINLEQSTRRLGHMDAQLRALNLSYIRVEAVDGAALARQGARPETNIQPHLGRALSPGEIGCLSTHLLVLDRIVHDRLPLACVLEDDVTLAPDFGRVLAWLAEHPARWDLVLLGHHSARHAPHQGAETCFRRRSIDSSRQLGRVAEFAMGAYAYVVTARGAERLRTFAQPPRMPMDWATGYAPAAGMRLWAVTPPCVVPDSASAEPSTIGGRQAAPAEATIREWPLRAQVGKAFLLLRKAGVWTNGYVRRY